PLRPEGSVILWPVWGWRVSAPGRGPAPLDLFALHVLRLCSVGLRQADSIADKLGLEPELIRHVMFDLIGRGAIGADGTPTENGLQTLSDTLTPTDDDWQDGWVFQDPWTGDLHPYFTVALNELPREYGEKGYIKIRTGSMGDGKPIRTFTVRPPKNPPSAPSSEQVLDACRRFRFLAGYGAMTIPMTQRAMVAFLDEVPTPFWLVLSIEGSATRESANLAEQPHWRPTDPFGLGRAEHFREALLREAKPGADTGRLLAEVILRGRTSSEATSAYEVLLSRYGPGHEREAWFSAALEMERLARTGEHKAAIKEARTALELALGSQVEQGHDAWSQLFADKEAINQKVQVDLLTDLARQLGFTDVPKKFLKMHPKAIREVFQSKGRNPG
ncbi:MAG TPA: hypothetical protein PK095_03175, partial [Myxococcota bacterium]|nr:hypothetical protein [Myxococcota bacterium]